MILANMANPTTWIIIAVVLLVLFGGSKIPELMKGVGQGVKELKKGMNEEDDDELRREKEKEQLRKDVLQDQEKEREKAKMREEIEREVSARLKNS